MNKRIVSFLLTLVLVMGLCGGMAYAETTVITTATNANALPAEENLLAGLTPVKPDGGAYPTMSDSEQPITALADGVMDTDTAHRWKGNASSGGRVLVYDLQATATITKFLVGSVDSRYVTGVDIYVGDDLTDLCAVDNLAVSANDIGTYHNTFSATDITFKGRFVAFDFTKTDMNWLGNQLRLSELGVYGTREVAVITTAITAVPEKTNLLTDIAPVNSSGTAFGTNSGSLSLITDGDFTTGEWMSNQGLTDAKMVFDLGSVCEVDAFLLGNATSRYAVEVTIYAGMDKNTLFTGGNLVVTASHLTNGGKYLFASSGDTTFTCRYVAFDFTAALADPQWSTGGNMIRLTELGVYGMKGATPKVTPIDKATPVSAVPNGENRLAGMTFNDKDGNNYTTMSDSEQPATVLTDGVLGTNDTVTTTRWRGDARVHGLVLVYDMKATVAAHSFLVGSTDNRYVTQVKIYIGDDLSKLLSVENLAVSVPQVTTLHSLFTAEDDRTYVGRYVAFDFTGMDVAGYLANQIRLSELGVYGDYTDGPPPTNLLLGKLPVERCEIPARGIDNQTAVDALGNPGSGNSGTFSERRGIYLMDGTVENITDGDDTTQANHHTRPAPSTGRSDTVDYDTPWIVLAYHLGGETKLSEVVFSSLPAYYYRIAGVQYYASYNWADLFKNESLLYTSGGEYYMEAANSTPEIPIYLPDSSTDVNVQQHLNYVLTDQQKAATYRYVAVVITRPHSRFVRDTDNTQVLKGWAQARIGDFAVYGNILTQEPLLPNVYTQDTVAGEVTMEVQYFNYDDRAFFEDTLAGFTLTAEPLPATAQTSTNANWLSVEGNTVYRVTLVDKDGNPIPETHEDVDKGLNGREVQFVFPSTADYVQTMGVLRGDNLTRVYNAFSDINNGGRIQVGALNYPTYADTVISNRDKATLYGTEFCFVYMKANDIVTANKLSGIRVNQTLEEFTTPDEVAGAAATCPSLWLWIAVTLAALTAGGLLVRCARREKGGDC